MLLHGIFPPITTPFYPDGKVYYNKLEANVERYSRTPIAGIVVMARPARQFCFPIEEARGVEVRTEAAATDKVLIAGTGIESAIETLRSPNTPPNSATTSPWCARRTITRGR